MSVFVSDIHSYNHPDTWFDLTRYQAFGQAERVHVDLQIEDLWTIDSRDLFLNYSYAPKLAFINEGATYRSRLDLNVSGTTTGQATLFQEVSGINSILPSRNAPLQIGDWVQISEIQANSQLNFNLFVNSVVNPKALSLSTDPRLNPDWGNAFGRQFWVAYADPSATRPVVILGYEDVVGGSSDNDYNDGIFVLDVGVENFNKIFETSKLSKVDANSTIAAAKVDLTKPETPISAAAPSQTATTTVPSAPINLAASEAPKLEVTPSQMAITTVPSTPILPDSTHQSATAVPEGHTTIVYLALGVALLLGNVSKLWKTSLAAK